MRHAYSHAAVRNAHARCSARGLMRRNAGHLCRVALSVGLAGLTLASGVDAGEDATYETDMKAFVKEIDREYPFFSLKRVRSDWNRAKKGMIQRATRCESDAMFLEIVHDTISVLRDGHMGIKGSRIEIPAIPPQHSPGISFLPAENDRVVVMHAPENLGEKLKTGTVVTEIDGTDARQHLEDRAKTAWSRGGFFSSPQRARLFEYRKALRGDEGERHTITYVEEGKQQEVTLTCGSAAGGWPHTYNMPPGLERVGGSFYYGILASDVGYMYLRRIESSVTNGMDEAVKAHPDVVGWIVDLRGNGGGGYDKALIDRVKQLHRPVATLIDAGCFSAGETLARDLRAYADARLFGAKTAGSSSEKRRWVFPSGVASITFPVRSRWRNDKKPIEFNGIDPDTVVEAVPEELQQGKNSAILRAEEYIIGKNTKGQGRRSVMLNRQSKRQQTRSPTQKPLRASVLKRRTIEPDVDREMRTWTSRSGQELTASLLREIGSSVILKKEDGVKMKIEQYKLSKRDREYIEQLRE